MKSLLTILAFRNSEEISNLYNYGCLKHLPVIDKIYESIHFQCDRRASRSTADSLTDIFECFYCSLISSRKSRVIVLEVLLMF